MFHARPHLETHSRADAHSSVAGAAYRLGLKLYDRRLKRAFDFRKRTAGEEVVFQTTVAPFGAPEWATDPLELWNRAEAAERRKDAQIARDYRIPLPLGLSDAEVCAMATDIARYISQKLTTPVSVGVHRDAPITAFGATKSDAQIGCHAHLYFPTRKILLDDEAARDGEKGGSGMGEKLSFLSNKSTSGYFLEDINKAWADAANRYTAAAGLTADYDHRSYRKMGIKVTPQPRLGEAATALERMDHRTRRGAHVLEIAAVSDVYRRLYAERKAQSNTPFVAPADPQVAPFVTAQAATGAQQGSTADPVSAPGQTDQGQSGNAQAPLSLTERFRQLYFVGMEEGDRPEETLVFRLVMLIERALARLKRSSSDLIDIKTERAGAQTAHLDAKAALDDWRAGQRAAELEAVKQARGWQRVVQSVGAWMNPADPIEIHRRATEDQDVEQRLESRVGTTAAKVQDLVEQAKPLEVKAKQHLAQMRTSVRELHQAHESALPQLLAVCWEEERDWIERFWPELLGPIPDADEEGRGRGQFAAAMVTPRVPQVPKGRV